MPRTGRERAHRNAIEPGDPFDVCAARPPYTVAPAGVVDRINPTGVRVQRVRSLAVRPALDSDDGTALDAKQLAARLRTTREASVECVAEQGETGESAGSPRGRRVVVNDAPAFSPPSQRCSPPRHAKVAANSVSPRPAVA